MPKQNPLTQKFHAHCAKLQAQSNLIRREIKHLHVNGIYWALQNCFAQFATPNDTLVEVTQNGIAYQLTTQGYGLQIFREAEGGVRGDAYRDYLTLLLPNNVIISTDITEDSYQPELTFEIMGLQTADANHAEQVLVDALQKLEQ